MTKQDLVERIFSRLSDENKIPKRKLKRIVQSVFDYISHALLEGQEVKVWGFGTFRRSFRKGKRGRNPKTGEVYHIPPRITVTFRISKKTLSKVSAIKR